MVDRGRPSPRPHPRRLRPLAPHPHPPDRPPVAKPFLLLSFRYRPLLGRAALRRAQSRPGGHGPGRLGLALVQRHGPHLRRGPDRSARPASMANLLDGSALETGAGDLHRRRAPRRTNPPGDLHRPSPGHPRLRRRSGTRPRALLAASQTRPKTLRRIGLGELSERGAQTQLFPRKATIPIVRTTSRRAHRTAF